MTMETEYQVKEAPTCPHCKSTMEKMDARHLDWGTSFLWVCFNNNCEPFKKGWEHMMNTVGQLVSYRFMITPDNGSQGVIPAFSAEYLANADVHLWVAPMEDGRPAARRGRPRASRTWCCRPAGSTWRCTSIARSGTRR